jgi:hypothetical protein
MTKPAARPSKPSLEKIEEAEFSGACGGPHFSEKDVIFDGTNLRIW